MSGREQSEEGYEARERSEEGYEARERSEEGYEARERSEEDDYETRELQCGVGSCRPGWMRPCGNMKLFTVTLSAWSLFGSINFSYYTAVITQIEKQFGLPSSVTGLIKNVDNIGYLSTVLIFSHFCRYANKPRLFAGATLASSLAIFLFSVPHFLYGVSHDDLDTLYNISLTNSTQKMETVEFCDGIEDEQNEQYCKSSGTMNAMNTGAIAIFILSELLQGLAQSPKFTLSMTYMDDNAKNNSPKHFSVMLAMRAFSPVLGFMMGAWTTSIYVDLSDPDLSQRDPRWVGAWWLGFVICALCSVAWAIPMLFFPPVLRGGDGKVYNTKTGQDIASKAKDLPRALGRLFRNKLFVCLTLGVSARVGIMGFFTFLPKYLEHQFGLTPSISSILTGVVGALSWALGPIIMGQIMSRTKTFTPYRAMKFVVGICVIVSLGYGAMMFIGCPEARWAGNIHTNNPDLTLACNSNCSCNSESFLPVHGEDVDGNCINYYSPCHAGCLQKQKENGTQFYTDCQCVPGGVTHPGTCHKKCNALYPYAALLFITKFVSSMDMIPMFTLLMRCVESKDKATSLATFSAILQVFSFPAPLLFGFVIDSACSVLQSSCDGRQGACLLYDNDTFRWRLHGFTFAIQLLSTFIFLFALFFSREVQYHDEDDQEKNANTIKNKIYKENEDIDIKYGNIQGEEKHKMLNENTSI